MEPHPTKGDLIGDDGKSDGKIHVVTDNKQAKSIADSPESTKTDLSKINHVTLNGGKATVDGVIASVEAAASDGLHEEGGHTETDAEGKSIVKKWTPGETRTGLDNASITPFAGASDPGKGLKDNWHVHTSGTVTTKDAAGNELTVTAALGPSPADKNFAGSMATRGVTTLQVDTRGGTQVNFINGSGTVASMKFENFKKLK